MASGATALQRARSPAALALLALATTLLLVPLARQLADPDFPGADEFQGHLDAWARVLAPVATLVPPGEALAYACQSDARGEPSADLERWFPFLQAVLAPRRIGREVEARYLLVHYEARAGTPPGFGDARVLAELAPGLALVERVGR